MKEKAVYSFKVPIEKFAVGKTKKIWYNVIFLPFATQQKLPFKQYPRLRVTGTINNIAIENGCIPTGDGRYYIIVSPDVLNYAEVSLGEIVAVHLQIADQNHVNVPDALQHALRINKEAQKCWDQITPGKKRMLSQHVFSAKTEPTQERRIIEAIDALIHFKADLRAWRKFKK